MNEGNISPLARRIAEENNVNWRSLQGSGPDGRIVERDVIAYLQRVTAGDEPVDPTPEPLPEGMEAWPEEDVTAYRQQQSRESAAPVDDDLQDDGFIETDFSDEDLLDIDDLENESLLEIEDEAPAMTQRADDDFVSELDWRAPEPEEELGFDFQQEPASQQEEGFNFGPQATTQSSREEAIEAPGPEDEAVTLETSGETEREEQVFSDALPSQLSRVEPEPEAFSQAPSEPHAEPPSAVPSAIPSEERLEDDTEGATPEELPRAELSEAASMEEAAAIPPVASAQAAPEAATRQASPAGLGLPLMRSGLLVRASVDLTPIVEAQSAVSRGTGQEDAPIATAFLLRAVAKALQESPLGEDDAPALALISAEGFGAKRIEAAASLGFRDLLQELATLPDAPPDELERAGVLVANLSDYDLDEAVLVVGMPVIALGRVFFDNETESYSSTLTLSGELPPAQAAAFLGRVVELLDSPLELVL